MARIRFRVDPKDVPPDVAARRLGLDLSAFQLVLPSLLDRGFPSADPTTGHFDLDAIDQWRRRRHADLFADPNAPRSINVVKQRLEAMRNG